MQQRARIHKGRLADCKAPQCQGQEQHTARTIQAILSSPEFIAYGRRREREWDDSKATRSSFSRYNKS